MFKKILITGLSVIALNIGNVLYANTSTDQQINLATQKTIYHVPAPVPQVKAYLLMEYETGTVLAGKNIHEKIVPASLTKMLTSYVIGDLIKKGKISGSDTVEISKNAWSKNYSDSSKMFIEVGQKIPLSQLNQGIIVASGNDACIAAAEYIAGTEQEFAKLLNTTAKNLGLKNSNFVNSHGLYDKNHYSTAYDMALLARALIRDLPEEYAIFAQKEILFNGIKQKNRNQLLWDTSMQVDGIKTGHLSQVGYNLVASAVNPRNGMRLISVVIGDTSEAMRTKNSKALLEYGLKYYDKYTPLSKNQTITTKDVLFGETETIKLGINKDINLIIQTGQQEQLKASFNLEKKRLSAPIKKEEVLGKLTITLNNEVIATTDLVALEEVKEAGFISRTWDLIKITVMDWFE